MAFEREESFDGEILIEWDEPIPPPPLRMYKAKNLRVPGESIWSKRLRPFRKNPGREARILQNLATYKIAKDKKANIEWSLRKNDDHEKWTIKARGYDGDRAYGVWATYEGRYTEAEFLERERLRFERNRAVKEATVRNQRKRAMAIARTDGMNRGLSPPLWGGE